MGIGLSCQMKKLIVTDKRIREEREGEKMAFCFDIW